MAIKILMKSFIKKKKKILVKSFAIKSYTYTMVVFKVSIIARIENVVQCIPTELIKVKFLAVDFSLLSMTFFLNDFRTRRSIYLLFFFFIF